MFEVPEEKEEASRATLWIAVAVVVVLAVVGTLAYMNRGGAKSAAPAAPAASVPAGKADAVHDLRVVSAKMDKDPTGVVAMWSVEIKNGSQDYSYSNIAYETTYAGAGNNILTTNQGTIKLTIGAGEEQTANFRDALYPTGTAWYKIKITSATAGTQ